MKLVRVSWLDIVSETGWQELDKYNTQPHICWSVGYLIQETEQYIALAATYSDAEDIKETNSRVCIPRGCIVLVDDISVDEGS